MRRMAVISLALTLAGCAAQREYFRPTERAEAMTDSGYVEARYDVTTSQGRVGEVKLWSLGSYRGEVNGKATTLVHVGFEIENAGNTPLVLDLPGLWLDTVRTDKGTFRGLRPVAWRGKHVAPPHSRARVDGYFALPVQPQRVDAFDVRWNVRAGHEQYAQFTPFVEDEWTDTGYGYYDPSLISGYAVYDVENRYYNPWAYRRVVIVRDQAPPRRLRMRPADRHIVTRPSPRQRY